MCWSDLSSSCAGCLERWANVFLGHTRVRECAPERTQIHLVTKRLKIYYVLFFFLPYVCPPKEGKKKLKFRVDFAIAGMIANIQLFVLNITFEYLIIINYYERSIFMCASPPPHPPTNDSLKLPYNTSDTQSKFKSCLNLILTSKVISLILTSNFYSYYS